jgi:hypothetical protein
MPNQEICDRTESRTDLSTVAEKRAGEVAARRSPQT